MTLSGCSGMSSEPPPQLRRWFDFSSFYRFSLYWLLFYVLTMTQCPALVFPSRIRMPIFCMAERSRWIVRWTTDKTSDISCADTNGFSFMRSSISICLSVSWTCDRLTTSLTTSSEVFHLVYSSSQKLVGQPYKRNYFLWNLKRLNGLHHIPYLRIHKDLRQSCYSKFLISIVQK